MSFLIKTEGFKEKLIPFLKKHPWVISSLFVFSLYLILCISMNIVFYINDDTNILYTLAGYYTNGIPSDHPFLNAVLSYVLQFLYLICGSVPWYGLFHFFSVFLSLVIINAAFLKIIIKRDYPLLYALLFCCCVTLVFFVYPMVLLQFTTTSTLLGTAALLLMLNLNQPRISDRDFVGSVILLVLSYMVRKNSGQILLCFWILTLIYLYVKEVYIIKLPVKNLIVNYFKNILLLSFSFALVFLGNFALRSSKEWENYFEFDTARFHVQDYPHDTKSDNPELYESLGWTDGLCNLVGYETWSYFMMDERITTDSFNEIAKTATNHRIDIFNNIKSSLRELWESNVLVKITFVSFISAAIYLLGSFFKNFRTDKEKIFDLLYAGLIFFAFAAGVVYLCIVQRVPMRAFQTLCFPASVSILFQIINVSYYHKLSKFKRRFLIFFMSFIICFSVVKVIPPIKNDAEYRYNISQNMVYVEKYVMEHPDNFYVYDTSLTFRYLPFINYNSSVPDNIMYWGGMGWKSPTYYKQLEINNIDELYSSVLLQNNAFYITNDDYKMDSNGTTVFNIFEQYMIEKFPNIRVYKVDTIKNNIIVYKFEVAE